MRNNATLLRIIFIIVIFCEVISTNQLDLATKYGSTTDTEKIALQEKQSADDDSKHVSKRANFMPSRGKKESIDYEYSGLTSHQIETNDGQHEMKKASSFLPMRGRKDNYPQWYVGNSDAHYEADKRAGFMPMRGRKSDDLDLYQSELDSVKRAAFMPMRGRKSDDYNVANRDRNANAGESEFVMPSHQISTNSLIVPPVRWIEGGSVSGDNEEMEKRAKAFYGARGKRWTDAHFNEVGPRAYRQEESNSGRSGHPESFFAARG